MTPAVSSLLMTIGLWLGLVVACCGGSRSLQTAEAYRATYEVGGTAGRVSVTYTNAAGDTEQQEVYLPWSKSFKTQYGEFLYISAQNQNDSGTVTTTIKVNGVIQKSSSSSGGFVIATSSYRCCE